MGVTKLHPMGRVLKREQEHFQKLKRCLENIKINLNECNKTNLQGGGYGAVTKQNP
jgi:hypothetical protein